MSTFAEKLTQLSIESIFPHFEREKRVKLKKKVPVLRSIHVPIHIPRLTIYTLPHYLMKNDTMPALNIEPHILPEIWIEMSENQEKTKVTIGGCEKYSSFGWKTVFRNFLNFLVFRTGNTVAHLELQGAQDITNFFEKPPNGVNHLTIRLESEWPLDFLLKFQNLRSLFCTFNVKVPKGYFKHENFKHLESLYCNSGREGIENSLELLDLNVKRLMVADNSSSYETFLTCVKKFSTGRYSQHSQYTALNITGDQFYEKLQLDVPTRETTLFEWNPPQIFLWNRLTIDISDEIELHISFYEDSLVTCMVEDAGTSYPRIIRREVVENKRMRLE